jgi:hypothetical protein
MTTTSPRSGTAEILSSARVEKVSQCISIPVDVSNIIHMYILLNLVDPKETRSQRPNLPVQHRAPVTSHFRVLA